MRFGGQHVAGYNISGPPAIESNTILVIREYQQNGAENIPELQLMEAVRAVTYIKDSLVAGIPVMIGVKLSDYPDEPNNIWKTPHVIATDHFVVAVGMGFESNSPFINIYDYLNVHADSDRLYLTPC